MNLVKSAKFNSSGLSSLLLNRLRDRAVIVGPDRTLKVFDIGSWDWTDIVDTDDEFNWILEWNSDNTENRTLLALSATTGLLFNERAITEAQSKLSLPSPIIKADASKDFVLFLTTDGKLYSLDKSNQKFTDLAQNQDLCFIDIIKNPLKSDSFFCLSSQGDLFNATITASQEGTDLSLEPVDTEISQALRFEGRQPGKANYLSCNSTQLFITDFSNGLIRINMVDWREHSNVEYISGSFLSNCHYASFITENLLALASNNRLEAYDVSSHSLVFCVSPSEGVNEVVLLNDNLCVLNGNGVFCMYEQPSFVDVQTEEVDQLLDAAMTAPAKIVESPKKTPTPVSKPSSKPKNKKRLIMEEEPLEEKPKSVVKPDQTQKEDSLNLDDSFMNALDVMQKEKDTPNQIVAETVQQPIGNILEEPHNALGTIIEEKPRAILQSDEKSDSPPERKVDKKVKDTNARIFELMERYPQSILYVGSSLGQNGRKFIRVNATGTISLYESSDINTIEVEFADNNLHKKLLIDNKNKFSMGDISEKGVVLASQGKVVDLDEYEDEDELKEENQDQARIYVKLVGFDYEWTVAYPMGENIEYVSISSQFVIVLTSQNLIRVYDLGGNEIYNFTFDSYVVSICSFEHFIAVVYNTGLPLFGFQSLKVKCFNMRDLNIEFDVPIAITPRAKLQWVGFSDDGILYTQDTDDCIRIMHNRQFWVPVYFNDGSYKFWMIGVMDKELIGYKLHASEKTPNPLYKYQVITQPRQSPISETPSGFFTEQADIIQSLVDLENEKEKLINFQYIKDSTTQDVYRNIFKEKISSPEDIAKQLNDIEVKKIDYIRKLCVEEKHTAALFYALRVKTFPHFQIVLNLLDKLKLKKLSENLRRIANEFGHFAFLSSKDNALDYELPNQREQEPAKRSSHSDNERLERYLKEQESEKKNENNFFGDLKQKLFAQNEEKPAGTIEEKPSTKIGTFFNHTGEKRTTNRDLLGDLGKLNKNGTDGYKPVKKINK